MYDKDNAAISSQSSSLSPVKQQQEEDNNEDAVLCPCQSFASLPSVLECMNLENEWKGLLQWIGGATDKVACEHQKRLSCGKRTKCRFRFGLSFLILNAIRDAARPFLEVENKLTSSASATKGDKAAPQKYEDAFPSLMGEVSRESSSTSSNAFDKPKLSQSENVLIPRKKSNKVAMVSDTKTTRSGSDGVWVTKQQHPNNDVSSLNTNTSTTPIFPSQQVSRTPKTIIGEGSSNTIQSAQTEQLAVSPGRGKKQKRRIRPQSTTMCSMSSSSIWGSSANVSDSTFEFGTSHGNIANLPSKEPLTLRKSKAFVKSLEIELKTNYAIAPPAKTSKSSKESDMNMSKDSKTQQSLTEDIFQPCKEEHVQRLVDVYIILIESCLVPSSILELHLLMRLLTIPDMKDYSGTSLPVTLSTNSSSGTKSSFDLILSSPERCRNFAKLSLQRLHPLLENMPIPVITALLRHETFGKDLPNSKKKLQLVYDEQISQGVHAEYRADEVTGTHAILSLPFDPHRDSRHNYKTQQEIIHYKNREEIRDVFLFQLRSFMNVRGRILDSQEADQTISHIKTESQKVASNLLEGNVVWFADFFVELLLQIGLTPIGETDEDILEIGDRDKLQKLHKRFSSKSLNTRKSTKKLVLKQGKQTISGKSFVYEATQKFVGHQEFFFVFLQSTGSFPLCMHLRSKIASTLLELSANISSDEIEKRLLNMQLLSKFLGFLVFSPNWQNINTETTGVNTPHSMNGMEQLKSLGIDANTLVLEAWGKGKLLTTVPWVIEILRMAKWDLFSQQSTAFRQLHGRLRHVQSCLGSSGNNYQGFGPTMQLVYQFLESYFHEELGLSKITSLPTNNNLAIQRNFDDTSVDSLPLGFSTAILFSSDPNFEEFLTLITYTPASLDRTPSKARKLRPSVVSTGINYEMRRMFDDSSIDGVCFSLAPEYISPTKHPKPLDTVGLSKHRTGKAKLIDAFFHQHRDIKEVCEFVITRVLKTITSDVVTSCIKPSYVRMRRDVRSADVLLSKILSEVNIYFCNVLARTMHQSLAVFCPHISDRILDTSVKLTIARGQQLGQAILNNIVTAEMESMKDLVPNGAEYGLEKRTVTSQVDSVDSDLEQLNTSLSKLFSILREGATKYEQVEDQFKVVDSWIDRWTTISIGQIQANYLLRPLFKLSFKIDQQSHKFLIEWNDECSDARGDPRGVVMIYCYFKLICKLDKQCQFGFRNTCKTISHENFLLSFVRSALHTQAEHGVSTQEIASLFIEMVRRRFVGLHSLRNIWLLPEDGAKKKGPSDDVLTEFCRHAERIAMDSLGRSLIFPNYLEVP